MLRIPDSEWLHLNFEALAKLQADFHSEVSDSDLTIYWSRSDTACQVTQLLLDRLADPLTCLNKSSWSPAAEILIQTYGRAWGAFTEYDLLSGYNPEEITDPEDFCSLIRNITEESRCGETHPIFDFLQGTATKEALAEVLRAENLCDLNFAHLLCVIMPGVEGTPAAEMAENLWDEWGHGQVDGFHRNIRKQLMANAGLAAAPAMRFIAADYLPCELEHFNAYALNGTVREYNLRLIGMLYATEFLVPRQLGAVIEGWRRVGFADADMKYLLDHYEGDVEHADGWAESVIKPVLIESPGAARELLLGALQHVDILGRLYDELLAQVTSF